MYHACLHSRRESPPAQRSEQAGTWRWVGAVGFRADGNGGRPAGSAGTRLRSGCGAYRTLHYAATMVRLSETAGLSGSIPIWGGAR